ncbi:DUF2975 domain-containing protein [Actinokineospora soli]|uniref:DUF2975 domain-containing protein n=1 Tax=Actinokineospora soli TaxID=1048753 RepID=A0ABW2TR75_9PSEU
MGSNLVEPARVLVTAVAAVVMAVVFVEVFATFTQVQSGSVCLDVPQLGVHVRGEMPAGTGLGLAPGVELGGGPVRACVEGATGTQRVLGVVVAWSDRLFVLVTVAFGLRLFTLLEREGVFTARAERRMRVVGWVVIAGSLVSASVAAVASAVLLVSMVPGHGLWSWMGFFDPSVPVIVLGAVLLSVSRVVEVGAGMRADLEGTV